MTKHTSVNRRIAFKSVAAALLAQAAVAQAPKGPGTRRVFFEHDIPNLDLRNWAVTASHISLGPGEGNTAHRHPGLTFVYVLEGEVFSKVGDGPQKTYKAGEMYMENPNELHAVSRNASETKPARVLALLMAEKGKQLTVPEK